MKKLVCKDLLRASRQLDGRINLSLFTKINKLQPVRQAAFSKLLQ